MITYDGLFLPDEDTVANSEVLDEVVIRIKVELDLEVATSVLLGRLLVLVRDHEVVHHSLLRQLA
jgi:hypothetical protein